MSTGPSWPSRATSQQMLAWHFVDGHGGADGAGFGVHHREALDAAFLQLEHVIGKVFPARKNIAAHQGICLVGIDDGIEEHRSAAPGASGRTSTTVP